MRLALILVLLLSACAESRQACLRRAELDLRDLDAQIADTETALALGYRTEESKVSFGLAACNENSSLTVCLGGSGPIRTRRVIIDAEAESRNLAVLKARRPQVAAQAESRAAACPAQ